MSHDSVCLFWNRGFFSFVVSPMALIHQNLSHIFKHAGFHCLGRRYQMACLAVEFFCFCFWDGSIALDLRGQHTIGAGCMHICRGG